MNPSDKKLRVVLIEDSITEILVLERLLTPAGFNVIHTDSLEKAVDAISSDQNLVDLIICDLDLVDKNPSSVLQLKGALKENDIPVIFLHSETEKDIFDKTESLNAYGFILKDSSAQTILSTIKLALRLHRQNRNVRSNELTLRRNKASLSVTLNSIGDGVIATDVKGNIILMNPVAEKLCGWSFNEAKGHQLSEVFYIINAKSKERVVNPVEKVLETGQVIGLANHTVLISRDGTEYQIADSAAPIRNEAGEQLGVVLVFSDVTDKYKKEEALRESEELFRTTFENATAGVCLTGTDGKFLRINSMLCRMFGYSAEELITLRFNDITHNEDKEIGLSFLKDMVAGRIDHANFEKRYISKTGQILWCYLSVAIVREDSKPKYFITHIQDISERIKAEKALLQSEKKYRLIFENSPIPMWIYDPDSLRFLEVNNAAIENYGYSRREFLQMTITDLHLQSELEDLLEIIANPVDENSRKSTSKHRKKNGEIIYVNIISHLIEYERKRARLVLSNDINEIIRTQHELLKAKKEAEKSDKLKSEFLAQMSHEIRSPISTMLNFISLIREDVPKPLSEEMAFSFNAIDSSSRRLIRTIDLILNMSQVQTGYLECNYKQLDLEKDILNGIIDEYSSSAEMKGLKLNLLNKYGSHQINADSYTVIQIFSNLINNAIKYTKSGEITVTIYEKHVNQKRNICVDVSDTGIGISEEYIGQIFTPFSQEEQGYTRKFEGNGLGLALVRKYCELNNAVISVKSRKGEGSTFTVKFCESIHCMNIIL